MHRRVAGMVAVSIAFGIASCGGSDSLSKADFVSQATAMCKQAQKQAQIMQTASKDNEGRLVQLANAALARHRKLVDKLDTLEPPSELSAGYAEYVKTLRSQDGLNKKVLDEAEPDSDGTVKPGTPMAAAAHLRDQAAHKAFELARRLNIEACGG